MLCGINRTIEPNYIDINPKYNIIETITTNGGLVPILHTLFDSMKKYVLQTYLSSWRNNFNDLINNFREKLINNNIEILRIETSINDIDERTKDLFNTGWLLLKFIKCEFNNRIIVSVNSIIKNIDNRFNNEYWDGWGLYPNLIGWDSIVIYLMTREEFDKILYIESGVGIVVIDSNNKYEIYTNMYEIL